MNASEQVRRDAGLALDALGDLSTVWHNRFSTEELHAISVVRQALWREMERREHDQAEASRD